MAFVWAVGLVVRRLFFGEEFTMERLFDWLFGICKFEIGGEGDG